MRRHHGGHANTKFATRSRGGYAEFGLSTKCLVYGVVLLVVFIYAVAFSVLDMSTSGNSASEKQKSLVLRGAHDLSRINDIQELLRIVEEETLEKEKNGKASALSMESEEEKPKEKVHIVFSTSCNLFQQWQAQVLSWSIKRFGQQGVVTRIVSGCDGFDESMEDANKPYVNTRPLGGLNDKLLTAAEIRNQNIDSNIRIHFTPTFPGSKRFPWINKPKGILHWLENAQPPVEEEIIVILDPDMIMLDPVYDPNRIRRVSKDEVICTTGCHNRHLKTPMETKKFAKYVEKMTDEVWKDHPIAQTYGLGSYWMEKMDMAKICGENSKCTTISPVDIRHYYPIGPPYFMHVDNLKALAPKWVEYMPAVYEADPSDIQADMYAFLLAAVQLDLPHRVFDHFMVSNLKAQGEGWDWVDELILKDEAEQVVSCSDPLSIDNANEEKPRVPTFLHMAQRYDVGMEWMFHKGHVPPNIFTCELPLLKEPPPDLIRTQTNFQTKRAAWMVCVATKYINAAVLEWKRDHCNVPFNTSKQIKLAFRHQRCLRGTEGKTCWPLAYVEPEDET